jgi:ankyrin repeat protein
VRCLGYSAQLSLILISDRFRWAYCQLDTLRRCFPPSIRKTLNELPTTLDETYERTLEGIPKEKTQYAHRLFQCLVGATRPLRVEELGEIFAIESDQDAATNLMEDWRPENPEEAILSACSTLITIIDDDEGSKIVQFSHFSVKEFLTSDRLRTSEVGNIRDYHIPPDAAHTILARACLTVLLQLDEDIDKKRLATFPLAFYAAEHWVIHAKYEGVAPRVQDAMEQLFNPTKPYLASWVWIYDVDNCYARGSIDTLADRPSRLGATALYYAVSCGLCGFAEYLISTHGEDVNAKCGYYGSSLRVAAWKGHLDAMSLLLDHGANVDMAGADGCIPLCAAISGQNLAATQLLLERGAAPDVKCPLWGFLTHYASGEGLVEVTRLLLQHNADVNATDRNNNNYTPLHFASSKGYVTITQILLDHGADINAISDNGTPLYQASIGGHLEVARLLLKRGADVNIQGPEHQTPFQAATKEEHAQIAQLLLEHGANKE